MLTRTGRRLLEEDPEGAARAIAAADQERKEHADLSKDKAQVLKDCWVQKTDMDSAARKLGMKRETVQMWYYRFAMMEMRQAIQECRVS